MWIDSRADREMGGDFGVCVSVTVSTSYYKIRQYANNMTKVNKIKCYYPCAGSTQQGMKPYQLY